MRSATRIQRRRAVSEQRRQATVGPSPARVVRCMDAFVDPVVPGPAAVEAGAVVPHHQVVGLPAVPIDEPRLGGPLQKLLQQGAARLTLPSDNVGGVRPHVEGFLARLGDGADQHLADRGRLLAEGIAHQAGSDLGPGVSHAVLGNQSLQLGLPGLRQSGIGGPQTGVLGLAPMWRHDLGRQHGGPQGDGLEGTVGMPEHVAGLIEGPAVLRRDEAAFLIHVGDAVDGTAASVRIAGHGHLQPAEPPGEGHLLLVGDVLIVEDQDRMPVKGPAKLGKGLLTLGRGRVKAPHLGCDVCFPAGRWSIS